MITLQQLRAALGGEITGNQVLCPGPDHPPRDRSLAVRPTSDGSFIVHTFSAADDWRTCRDYVRSKLGLLPWQPGDERDRRVPRERVRAFDQAVVDREEERRPYTGDEVKRMALAVRIWGEGVDPRDTLAQKYLNEGRKLALPDAVAIRVLRFHPRCPWRDENTGNTIFVPTLLAAFTSFDDGSVTAIHRIRVDQPHRWPKTSRMMLGAVRRAAVILDTADDMLAIGEGVETCWQRASWGSHRCGRSAASAAFQNSRSSTASRPSRSWGKPERRAQPQSISAGRVGARQAAKCRRSCRITHSRT
jgi:putative DNA primase/helicase